MDKSLASVTTTYDTRQQPEEVTSILYWDDSVSSVCSLKLNFKENKASNDTRATTTIIDTSGKSKDFGVEKHISAQQHRSASLTFRSFLLNDDEDSNKNPFFMDPAHTQSIFRKMSQSTTTEVKRIDDDLNNTSINQKKNRKSLLSKFIKRLLKTFRTIKRAKKEDEQPKIGSRTTTPAVTTTAATTATTTPLISTSSDCTHHHQENKTD
jgi:hypothetical protein